MKVPAKGINYVFLDLYEGEPGEIFENYDMLREEGFRLNKVYWAENDDESTYLVMERV